MSVVAIMQSSRLACERIGVNSDRLDLCVNLRSIFLRVDNWHLFQDIKSVHTINNSSKDGIFHIKVRLFRVGNEKLRSVTIWSSVSHRHNSSSGMFQILS